MGGIMHSPVELSSLRFSRQIIQHPWNNHRIHRILSLDAERKEPWDESFTDVYP